MVDTEAAIAGLARADFTCDACGQTFPKGWSDEDAQSEANRDFPGLDVAEAAVVCDDCYEAMRAKAKAMNEPWGWS